MQARFKGCIFRSISPNVVSQVHPLSVESKGLPVSLPVFWSGSSPKGFHKANEGTHCNTQTSECETNCVPRRHSSYGNIREGNSSGEGHFDIFTTASRFSDQHQEVRASTYSGNSILRNNDGFSEDGSKPSSGQDRKYTSTGSGSVEEKISLCKGTGLYRRTIVLNSHCDSSGTSAISFTSEETNSRDHFRENIRVFGLINKGNGDGATLIGFRT